ncbi:hypothetical protein Ga0466249_001732 [Sporomusaceae bacterium BoRhaA]|uniref:metallophosphoesterase n=1 Tax=Pelorhabdus rhamnosifermentans TaxID=2772457 RepID=UPI001C0610B4|nr:metallophosphoesterase [Pelorhabdus rhamnosifermentans]MBU2700640.1 hypothetical protein [Pelorhabdus rhamnosifermentans]
MEERKSLFELFTEHQQCMNRRSFLKTCGASMLLASLPVNIMQAFAEEKVEIHSGATPDHVMLSWTMDPKTTQTVVWRAADSNAKGTIQWVKTEEFKHSSWEHADKAVATNDILHTEFGDVTVQYATIEGLKPSTHYMYRVQDGKDWSDPCDFVTQPSAKQPFKFLVFGDSQSGLPKNPEYGPWRTTIHNAYQAHSDAVFFMVVGDLVEVGQDYRHWNNWYAAAKDVAEKIPHMAVPGNHETYDVPEENHSVKPIYYTKQNKLPANGPDALIGQVYSFDYGDVHFSILDSQADEEGQYVPNMLQLEAEWLDNDLAATNQKWKIVLFHKTPYYNKAVRANEKLKAVILPVIDKHHVDVVINGHDHGYSRTYPIYQDSFVDSPAQGTVYIVAGRSGNKFYTDLSQKIWDAFFHDPQAEPNYLVVEAMGDQLVINAYTQSGELIERYSIDKVSGKDSPLTMLPERSQQPRLVIWGNMLQTPLLSAVPQKIADAWHVPLRAFFEFIGASVDIMGGGRIAVKYQKTNLIFQMNDTQVIVNDQPSVLQYPLATVQGATLIAAEDLKKLLGFGYRYDAKLNMLFLAK